MLTVIVTITGGLFVVSTVIVTIMTIIEGLYSANSYCDNNVEVYMQY